MVLGPDWQFARLQATRQSSGPHYFWLWRQEWMGARAGQAKARKTHEETANGGPSQAGGLGRTARTSPFSRARQAARPHSARAAGGPRTPGRVCDCGSAAFLTGHPLLTGPHLRAANPELGSIFSAAVSSGSRSSACTQGDGASPPGNLPAFRSPPPRFSPGPAPGLVAAERLLPMGALVPLRH